MKRLLLLAVLLFSFAALFNVTNIYAATENSQTSDNAFNKSTVTNNTTNSEENLTNQSSVEDAENISVNSTNDSSKKNQINTLNTSNSSGNNLQNNSNSNITDVQNSTDAAGDEFKDVRGIWLRAEDVNALNIDEIKGAGITDIFIKTNFITVPTYQNVLTTLLNKLKNTDIRVHAWVTCFKDSNGNWIDPQGQYSYTVKVPYIVNKYKTWYKEWYKSWYKYGGIWRYTWKYTWKYKWNYQYAYKDELRTVYDLSKVNTLINSISELTRNYNIDGIHLDYVRYPGTAYKYKGGTETITSFVKKVYENVKQIKPKAMVSAALMPECSVNAYYYGQDYAKLAPYLDFIVPMIYKGNYNKNSAWIASTTKWIVEHSGGKPVLSGLQTYQSDDKVIQITANELKEDIKSSINNGASGYVLFRYGLIDSDFFKDPNDHSIRYDLSKVLDAAARVKSYMDTNHALPNYVTIDGRQVKMPEMMRLMSVGLLQLNSGSSTSITLVGVNSPKNPGGDSVNGKIYKAEFLDLAQRMKSFIDSGGIAPNYVTSSLGKISYEVSIYSLAKILNFYNTNKALPNYVTIEQLKENSQPVPDNMQKYLQQTANCQVNDYRIKALASSLTNGVSSTYDKGVKIFNWVRDSLSYSFYYDTRYGAVNTYLNRMGNCVDHSHLLIALGRAAGIPARYVHGTCTFTSGNVYGHVWAQLYINGKWYDADAISSRNTFGNINNWYKNTAKINGNYIELPF